MSNNAVVNVITGNESVSDGFTKVNAFEVMPDGSEKPLGRGASNVRSEPSVQAIRGVRPQIGGRWTAKSMEVHSTVIKAVVMQRHRWGSLMKSACMYFYVHPDAPLIRVRVPLIAGSKGTYSEVVWTGNMEPIPSDMLEFRGVKLNPNFGHYNTESAQNQVFKIDIVKGGSLPEYNLKEQVLTDENGLKKAIQIPKRKRKVFI